MYKQNINGWVLGFPFFASQAPFSKRYLHLVGIHDVLRSSMIVIQIPWNLPSEAWIVGSIPTESSKQWPPKTNMTSWKTTIKKKGDTSSNSNWWFFHCHVSFRGGYLNLWSMPYDLSNNTLLYRAGAFRRERWTELGVPKISTRIRLARLRKVIIPPYARYNPYIVGTLWYKFRISPQGCPHFSSDTLSSCLYFF